MTVEAPPRIVGYSVTDRPDSDLMAACVHCGLCLNECPTYRVGRQEMDSPRGRIQLIRAVDEGHISLHSQAFLTHTFRCLDCRACETACPSGVKYGRLIEAVRAQTVEAGLLPLRRRIAGFALRHVFTRPRVLRLLAYGLRLYRKSGVQWLLRRTGILHAIAPDLAQIEALAPTASDRFLQASDLRFVPAVGEARYRVGFITGCIMGVALAEAHRASLRVLARNGCEIHIPEHQRCCGALHVHGGERETARELARRNIDAFESADYDAIIINSAGCGSTLKEYPELLDGDPIYGPKAEAFAARVKDFSEFLAEIGLSAELAPVPGRIAYQDACHLVHGQGISRQPRDLITAIPDVELVDIEHPTVCCGSAGLYASTDTELSMQILDEKLDAIQASGAEIIVSGNPGCLIQLRYGARRRGLNLRVIHLAELLDEAHAAAGV